MNNNIIKLINNNNNNKRVVITGLGTVNPLGNDIKTSWKNLIDGKCGIQKIKSFDVSDMPVQIAGQIERGNHSHVAFDINKWITPKEKRSQNVDFISFALCAASQALHDGNWIPKTEKEQERTGVAVGAGIGNLEEIVENGILVNNKEYRRISPFFIPKILINMAAGHISIKYKLKGPNHSCVTACATGANSIGDAFRFIQNGDADVMIAGGTESCINPLSIIGFNRIKALTTKYNNHPNESSRPFDINRDGFVIGEGAGILLLEEYEHAKNRKAKIYAEIKGYGCSSDAFHITSPILDGKGAARAMKSALKQSHLNPNDIDYINAHATSTPLGDIAENKAIENVFGSNSNLAISSTKGATGHLLGAAGSVEAIFAIKALYEGILPPTLNLHDLDSDFNYNYVPLQSQNKKCNAVLSNSFGFGGINVSLCFTKI